MHRFRKIPSILLCILLFTGCGIKTIANAPRAELEFNKLIFSLIEPGSPPAIDASSDVRRYFAENGIDINNREEILELGFELRSNFNLDPKVYCFANLLKKYNADRCERYSKEVRKWHDIFSWSVRLQLFRSEEEREQDPTKYSVYITLNSL